MAKAVADVVLDQALNYIKNATGLTMSLCSAQPTTLAEANSTYKLADVALAAEDVVVSGTAGRNAAIAAKAGVPVDAAGTANHCALYSGTELLYVTTTTSTALASGGTVDISTWTITINDPT